MSGYHRIAVMSLFACAAFAQTGNVLQSVRAPRDAVPALDPASPFWHGVPAGVIDRDSLGKPLEGRRTEVRSRWNETTLYLLYVCSYRDLYLKPDPDLQHETNKLWDWDVAEAFIGSDFTNIKRYKEFQVSPRGEWVDLDIDREHPLPEGGWRWNSEFRVAARVDPERHVWVASMEIPWTALAPKPPAPGVELRANFYRIEGPPPGRILMSWQPTNQRNFHVPEAFGILRLVEPGPSGSAGEAVHSKSR